MIHWDECVDKSSVNGRNLQNAKFEKSEIKWRNQKEEDRRKRKEWTCRFHIFLDNPGDWVFISETFLGIWLRSVELGNDLDFDTDWCGDALPMKDLNIIHFMACQTSKIARSPKLSGVSKNVPSRWSDTCCGFLYFHDIGLYLKAMV